MMLGEILQNQYNKCSNMLITTIENYTELVWFDSINYKSPVWQIIYHAVFYLNIYCSATEDDIIHWDYEKNGYHRFEKMHELRTIDAEQIEPYTKDEMIHFISFVKDKIPGYLSKMKPKEKCWPYWYNESQLEFQLNNIRHMQHHIGEIIERHDIKNDFPYQWE